jgi:hypothetical protein
MQVAQELVTMQASPPVDPFLFLADLPRKRD